MKSLDSSLKTSTATRFQFLDGYRGSLALIVLIIHCKVHENCELVNSLEGYSQSYSIAGFFMLSAFLLTYRLLKDLYKSTTTRELILQLAKYFIRRFFRIYVFYVLFYTIFKYILPFVRAIHREGHQTTYFQFLTLKYPGYNHLWTVPCEIKYYCFIPIFCLVSRFLGRRFSILLLFASIFWTIWDQCFNFFQLTTEETKFTSTVSSELISHFAVFIIGSETALAFFLIESNENLMAIIKSKWAQIILNYTSILIALIGLKIHAFVFYDSYTFKSKAVLFWASSLLMCLLCESNLITRFFSSSGFLRNLGKYSFSCYLFHVLVINVLKDLARFMYQHELIVLCVFVSYYVSWVSFYLVEDRLIRLANFLCWKLEVSDAFSKP